MMSVSSAKERAERRSKISLRGVVLMLAFLGVLALQSETHAAGGPAWVWQVTVQGQSQGQVFQRQGYVVITKSPVTTYATTNGANPFEVLILSGNPGAVPSSGAIQFATNNALYGSWAQIDLAYVAFDPQAQTISIQPDSRLSATGGNVFNAYSGLTADAYQIFGGLIQIKSKDGFNTISGTIDIFGTGAIFHSNTRYTATLSGRYIGETVL